jgi:hypothetical protein
MDYRSENDLNAFSLLSLQDPRLAAAFKTEFLYRPAPGFGKPLNTGALSI